MAWVHGASDDQYREIDRIYAAFDTVLVGRTTCEEMAAYWPGALSDAAGTETTQAMARRMHTYRKLVFSRSGRHKLTEWNNTEPVVVDSDHELAKYLARLKTQPGGDIHLSGGASFRAISHRSRFGRRVLFLCVPDRIAWRVLVLAIASQA
jgi:dihydrofolate reductase